MKDTVVVAGALANKPLNGGEAWVRLSWIRGLQRLGLHVELIEEIEPGTLRDEAGHPASLADSIHGAFFRQVTTAFGLVDVATLAVAGGGETLGRTRAELRDLARDATLLVNISGHLAADWLKPLFRRRAFVDIDPGFTQFWLAQGVPGHRLEGHHQYFTIGENIGAPDCSIPTGGVLWRVTRQPAVLDDWPMTPPPDYGRFTTVSSWRGAFGRVQHDGHRFGLKAHEFRKIRSLPGRAREELEIALDIHPDDGRDLEALRNAGWRVVDPRRVVPDPASFRRYVRGSAGELSVAQGIYVDTRSGWFSDRTVRYLASGRPAVVQDTGFDTAIPTGRGLHAFRTVDDAAAALRAVRSDYAAECRAARQLAEEYFDSDRVLSAFLDDALRAGAAGVRGLSVPGVRSRPVPGAPSRPVPGVRGQSIAAAGRHRPDAPERRRAGGMGGRDRLRILVAGRLAAAPGQGGAAWAVLQYLLGLRQLGHDVRFVEPLGARPPHSSDVPAVDSARGRYFRAVITRFGLEEVSMLWLDGRNTVGASPAAVRRWAADADLLINLSGVLEDPALLEPIPVRLYLDMDPAFTQLWHDQDGIDMGLGRHTHHATVGLALAAGETDLPDCGVEWTATLPPVVLEAWPRAGSATHDAATTVANWRAYGSIERNGVRYGQKAHSLRRFLGLPARSGTRFRIALSIHPDERQDIDALRAHGWELVDPVVAAGTPDAYARFVRGSALEFGVAKTGYVASDCGWFSDRSACYLAAGRPVLAQETGFSRHLPTGEGLLAFSTEDDALGGLQTVQADYPRHASAARQLAEDLFDSRVVLRRLLDSVGGTA